MSEVITPIDRRIVSSASATVNSQPVYTGGNLFDIQVKSPSGTLIDVQISGDKKIWADATDINGDATAALANDYIGGIREGGMWARFQVNTDSAGPQNFDVRFIIHKQGGQG